jgi:hypothetical protein
LGCADDARLTTFVITYKTDFLLSNERTNLQHEVGMQFSQKKKKIVTKMPYGNLNEISFSRKQGFVPTFV